MSNGTTATRRAILAGAASLPALAIPAAAAIAGPDPIFAAIECHRSAALEWMRQVDIGNELEEIIPAERREVHHIGDVDNPEIGKNDDPRWTAAQRNYITTSDAMENAACDLTNTVPTSIEGIAALLEYVAAYARGEVRVSETNYSTLDHLPDDFVDESYVDRRGRPKRLSFEFWIIENVRLALQAMAVRS